jgi:hypothetical protein
MDVTKKSSFGENPNHGLNGVHGSSSSRTNSGSGALTTTSGPTEGSAHFTDIFNSFAPLATADPSESRTASNVGVGVSLGFGSAGLEQAANVRGAQSQDSLSSSFSATTSLSSGPPLQPTAWHYKDPAGNVQGDYLLFFFLWQMNLCIFGLN